MKADDNLQAADADSFAALMDDLRQSGIEKAVLWFVSPVPFREGIHGTELAAQDFTTNASREDIKKSYCDFCETNHWEKEQFYTVTALFEQNGCRISKITLELTASSVTVIFHGEIDLEEPVVERILEQLDKNAFRVDGREVIYRFTSE